MSTKLLYIFGFVLIIVASYFYASNNATLTKLALKPSDIDYQAKNIHALQTNAAGNVNYRLTASEVIHYQAARTGTLITPKIEWQPNPARKVTFEAGQGTLNEATQEVVFDNKVKMVSQSLASVTSNSTGSSIADSTGPIQFDGERLTGNLLTEQVVSNQPILVTQGNNRFTANTMKADMNTGDYEFDRVAMTFMPAQ